MLMMVCCPYRQQVLVVCLVSCYVGCVMYADDLLLLSPSVAALQRMIDICGKEFAVIDMRVNATKSQVMVVGPTFHLACADVYVGSVKLVWVCKLKYLGVVLTAGKTLKF